MKNESINIEQSEAKELGPRNFLTDEGLDSHLIIQMQPSPKTDQIHQGSEITYKGMRYEVAQKGDVGTPGEIVELALLVLGPIRSNN